MATKTTQASPSHDQIAKRARELWERQGRPQGQDLQHWLDAERQLRGQAKPTGAPPGKHSVDESMEAERRLDGLIEQPPSPAGRTPDGERL